MHTDRHSEAFIAFFRMTTTVGKVHKPLDGLPPPPELMKKKRQNLHVMIDKVIANLAGNLARGQFALSHVLFGLRTPIMRDRNPLGGQLTSRIKKKTKSKHTQHSSIFFFY